MDKSKKEFFESERNETLSSTKQIENVNETTEQNKDKQSLDLQETEFKELQKNEDFTNVTSRINGPISPTISEKALGTTSVVWMDYTTESQLKNLIK